MKITLLYQVSHYIRVKKPKKYKELGPAKLPCYKRVLLYPTSLKRGSTVLPFHLSLQTEMCKHTCSAILGLKNFKVNPSAHSLLLYRDLCPFIAIV